jgi:hypothetical protein
MNGNNGIQHNMNNIGNKNIFMNNKLNNNNNNIR